MSVHVILGDLHVSISLGMGFSITLKLEAGMKLPGSIYLCNRNGRWWCIHGYKLSEVILQATYTITVYLIVLYSLSGLNAASSVHLK